MVAGLKINDRFFSKQYEVLTSQISVKPLLSKAEKRSTELTKFFVGGLGSRVNEKQLYWHFSKFGDIKEVSIMKNRLNMRSRGFGFVIFKASDVESLTCEDSTYHSINGTQVECKLAIRKEDMQDSKFLSFFSDNGKEVNFASKGETRASSLDSDEKPSLKKMSKGNLRLV